MEQQDRLKTSFSMEARYRMLVEAVTDYAIYMLDPDGFVVSWNAGAERLKGYTEAEILGRHFSLFYPPDDVEAGMPARTLATASGEGRFEAEGWRIRKDGHRFWAHVVVDPIRSKTGDLLGYAKVTRDLSERREAEETLRRSEDQFRLLVQSVTDYAIYMLSLDGIVTNWNAGARRIKGYTPEEVIGTHFSRFYREEDRKAGHPSIALATAAREGRFEAEGWRVRKDGSQFWANVVVDPVFDGAGRLIGFAKITRDVTEKRDAAKTLEEAREALFQSQKLDAIGQLTGGVAHDFNNLLMVVLTSLALLRRQLPQGETGGDKVRRLLDNATQAAQRGVALTQRMLAFARRQELRPVAVDVVELIHGMRDMLERTLGPSMRIDTVFPPLMSPVKIDANQLELAILNLVVNARDAMADSGIVVVSARETTLAESDASLPAGRYVCLSIRDNGSGMSAGILARATEPFFTTKGEGKGTGLGLPMVHGLAAQSGGRFELSSVEGKGTTAELWLPVAPPPRADDGVIGRPAPATPGSVEPLLVLAVDDDNLVLTGTVSMLQDLGHSVLTAASGREALALIRSEPGILLLVTDQVMPAMTGSRLIEQVRKERPELAAILASGYADLPSTLLPLVIRLAKPFDQDQLASAIAQVIELARSR